ncbi:MAG: glycosyltransferase family 2 protein [Candidatus Methanomethylophilaceae archaeon]|nr:glycosyltransferase family 2 protein [Candidatus Methanomethylophilaceae archaeon]
MSLLSVVIPTMNEEESIGLVIDELHRVLEMEGIEFEVLVVDTDSRDRTQEIAISKGALVVPEPRRGYGRAYKTGFQNAQGEYVVTLDADCTYPVESIPALLQTLKEEDLDFITTNRFGELQEGSMSGKHRFGNWLLTFNMNLLFRLKVDDSQSGMWVFRRDCLSHLDLRSDGMPFSEEIKIEAMRKLRCREVPIVYRRRVGEVKLSSWKDGRENLAYLWKKRFQRS